MATITKDSGFVPASLHDARVKEITFSNSYTTGGESITAGMVGGTGIRYAICSIKAPAGSVTDVYFNTATSKIQAFTAAAEVANATNLSALVVECVFYITI